MKYLLILIICQLFGISSSLNVLIWATTIGRSHISFMGGLADVISENGHNVTIIILKNDPDVNITGAKLVKNIIRFESKLISTDEWSYFNFKQSNIFHTKTVDMRDFFKLQSVNSRICESLLDDAEIMNFLKISKFDVAVVEFFHFCPAGIFELTGIKKVILATALGMTHAHYELLNLEMPLSYVPVQMTHLGTKMSFFDRVYNVLFHLASKFCYRFLLRQDQQIFNRRFGSNFPNLEELYRKRIDYVLANTNEFTESTRPTLQLVKYIGGSTIEEPEKLDEDFEKILSKHNIKATILFSLGSLLKSEEMPEFMRTAFIDAFKQFPDYTFIWKSTNSNNFGYPNIYFRDWVPQVDLLADPRVKAFITHSGMNSVQEALYFGVPMITIPIFADQDSNAMIAQEHGYAYGLDKFRVTKNDVIQAIRKVVGDDGEETIYAKNAKQASKILKSSKKSMRNEILRAVELSGSTETLSHLHVNTNHLNFIQYYNYDVYLFLLVILPASAYFLLKSSRNLHFRLRIQKEKSGNKIGPKKRKNVCK